MDMYVGMGTNWRTRYPSLYIFDTLARPLFSILLFSGDMGHSSLRVERQQQEHLQERLSW